MSYIVAIIRNTFFFTETITATMRFTNLGEEADNSVLNSQLIETESANQNNINIISVTEGSIRLGIYAGPHLFNNPTTLRRSIRSVISKILNAGNVDTSIEGTIYVYLIFVRNLKRGMYS